jgi:hypothetical protein
MALSPPSAHSLIVIAVAHAFASTFVWALVLIVIAFIPAAGMALSGRRSRVRTPRDEPAFATE